MQGDVNTVDRAYQLAVERQLSDAGGRENLHERFETWYKCWSSDGKAASEMDALQ